MRRLSLGLALIATLAVALMLTGCSSGTSTASTKTQCYANEALIAQEMKLFYEDSGTYPPIATVVQKMSLSCPSGGTYSFDATTGVVTCSVHGHP
jgi:ABC-type glycerol-3-phosphate transport system substrate-binding protein